MILDADAVTTLPSTLSDLIDNPGKREALSREISKMALKDADEKIVDKITEILK